MCQLVSKHCGDEFRRNGGKEEYIFAKDLQWLKS